jgi:hypothetical protein
MSLKGIEELLERGAREPKFAAEIRRDPKVLDKFDLTAEERAAILSGDLARLEKLGLDDKVTQKLFRGKTWA